MTATEELRRMLDERGIEHVDFNMTDKFLTMFGDGEHDGAYTENSVDTILTVYGASPAQAIDATLGRGTCRIGMLDTGDTAAYEHYEHIMHCEECHHEFGYVLYNEDGDTWMDERPHYCPNCGREVTAGAQDDG